MAERHHVCILCGTRSRALVLFAAREGTGWRCGDRGACAHRLGPCAACGAPVDRHHHETIPHAEWVRLRDAAWADGTLERPFTPPDMRPVGHRFVRRPEVEARVIVAHG